MMRQCFKISLVFASLCFAGSIRSANAADDILRSLLMADVTTDDNAPNPPGGQWLKAGPVRAKLEDGELRYLFVGDKEIVRRIYFGVRDGNWATAMPKFTKIEVNKNEDGFTVNLAADCRMGKVDYSWTGVINGDADGIITFKATGVP